MNSTQFQLTAAVYYSDFAREIIKTEAVSDRNYNLMHFILSIS